MNRKNNKKGFTIVELVIVIAVIGILAAVLIPTFSGVIDSANESAAKQAARNGYTECYAEDLTDGDVDGEVNGVAVSDDNYSVDDGVASYTATKGKYTAVYNGKTFTVNGSEVTE